MPVSKKPKKPEAEEEEMDAPVPSKIKKEKVVLVDPDEVIAPDKSEDAGIFDEVSEDSDGEDDGGLDEEELNPFHDKWEE